MSFIYIYIYININNIFILLFSNAKFTFRGELYLCLSIYYSLIIIIKLAKYY